MSKPFDKDPTQPVGGQTRPLGSAGGGVIIGSDSEDALPALTQSNKLPESDIATIKLDQNDHNTVTNREDPATSNIEKKDKSRGGLTPGEVFQGKYEILQLLGAGGMGQVYQARHLDLGTMVAIKVLHRNMTMDENAIERFKREARASAKIVHPNAVRVFDYGVEDGMCYLVMEFMEGESLRKRLNLMKRMSLKDVINLAEQVCYVLEVMHRKGIVHRDLKPDNVYFHIQEDTEIVKVLDFGLAKVSSTATQMVAQLTNPGSIVGTPHYMSPEQCQGIDIDGRSDLYSLGIIIYEMLSGKVPFDAENSYSLLFKHVNEPPTPLSEAAPDTPTSACKAVERLLAKEPADRFQTAKEFLQALCNAASVSQSFYLDLLDKSRPDNRLHEGRTGEISTHSHTRPVDEAKTPEIKTTTGSPALKYGVASVALLAVIATIVWIAMSKFGGGTSTDGGKDPISTNGGKTPPKTPAGALGENFLLIQGGNFTIGRDPGDCPDCKVNDEESPSHTVQLEPYYLSKFEVTNREYKEFIVAKGYTPPKLWKGQDYLPGTDDLPVTYVTWADAVAYCQWRSERDGVKYRLPTEDEWEHAARGEDARLYPWGNTWDTSLAHASKGGNVSPLQINKAPNNTEDVSPYGIYAMGGNVSEWTSSNFSDYPGSKYKASKSDLECRVVRGGSFNSTLKYSRTTYRSYQKPTFLDKDVGFRLAAMPPKK